LPWSINEAIDVLKWLIESHGGNDDQQAWRQICAYIAEAEKPSHNMPSTQCQHRFVVFTTEVRCGDCGVVYQRWDE
jgi:hypothetical protein